MKNIWILIIIALIAAAGIGYKFIAKPALKNESTVAKIENSKTKVKSSLKQMLGMGKNVSCEMAASEEQGLISGRVNIAGSKMMADFKMADGMGKMMDSHMINDGEYTYIWSSAAPSGTKIKNDSVSQAGTGKDTNSFDEDKEVDMDCSDWSPSSDSFKVPDGIEFLDMSTMMKDVMDKSRQPAGGGSSVCDAVSDPQAKAMCLQQIGN